MISVNSVQGSRLYSGEFGDEIISAGFSDQSWQNQIDTLTVATVGDFSVTFALLRRDFSVTLSADVGGGGLQERQRFRSAQAPLRDDRLSQRPYCENVTAPACPPVIQCAL